MSILSRFFLGPLEGERRDEHAGSFFSKLLDMEIPAYAEMTATVCNGHECHTIEAGSDASCQARCVAVRPTEHHYRRVRTGVEGKARSGATSGVYVL